MPTIAEYDVQLLSEYAGKYIDPATAEQIMTKYESLPGGWNHINLPSIIEYHNKHVTIPMTNLQPIVAHHEPMTNLQPIVAHHVPMSTLVASHPYVAPKQYQIKGGGAVICQ